jgi:Family of unknown function (DUF6281)
VRPDESRDPEIGAAVRRLPVPEHDRDVIASVVREAGRRRPFRRLGARRLALLAAAALVVVASASAALVLVTRGGGHAVIARSGSSCALAVRFDGVDYLGSTMKQPLHLGRALGQATLPPCQDSNSPGPPPTESAVDVVAIAGVPPSVAIGAAGDPHTAYLAVGYFPELPSYPLHEGGAFDYTSGCRVTGTFSLTGTVRQHGSALLVEVDGRSGSLEAAPGSTIQLLVDARTRIDGFDRNGLPYVAAGDRLRSSGVTCRFQGASSSAVVARTIGPDS